MGFVPKSPLMLLSVTLLACKASIAQAGGFLKPGKGDSNEDMVATLLQALGGKSRPMLSNFKLAQLEEALLPMYASLPKDHDGHLGSAVARYALRRLFVKRHGWLVRGLEPGSAGNFKSFETDGIGLSGLAVLAATLEDLIHKEAIKHLRVVYNGVGASTFERVESNVFNNIIDTYMTIYISGARFENASARRVREQKAFMSRTTQDWPETQAWIHDVQERVTKQYCPKSSTHCAPDFNYSTRIVEQIVEGYADFNAQECKKLKSTLLEMEIGQTGRVRLADFYKKGLSGTWEFNEKVDYLRAIGVLDESSYGKPRVIVANYLSSLGNCLNPSGLYAVCCRNECEDLMGHLEKRIAAPTTSPEHLFGLVEGLSTDTAPAPQSVSPLLWSRLQEIAGRHHGKVPLHGRLFAQWMHHVFPKECPYPHEAGTTNPQTPDEWMEVTGSENSKASEEEMLKEATQSVGAGGVNGGEDSMPWSDVEDVIVVRPPAPPPAQGKKHSYGGVIMVGEIVVCLALFFVVLSSARCLPAFQNFMARRQKMQI